MTVIFRRHFGAMALAVVALPAVALAQRGPRPGAPGPNPVAPLIDMRRQLDLSTRQLTALDSIERALLQRNRDVLSRIDARRDTSRARRDLRDLTPEERTQFRNQMQARRDSLQPLFSELRRNDSTARAAALRVLTDSQRVRVREFQAERRGFARGMGTRMRRPPDQRDFGPRGGPPRGFGPRRGEFAPRDQFGQRGGVLPRYRFRESPDGVMPRRPVPPVMRERLRNRMDAPLRRRPMPPIE